MIAAGRAALVEHSRFVRMFSSALASQALLSATNFLVGLLLIRHTSDLEYGSYMLVLGAIVLAVSLQNAFIGPAMVNRMTRLDATGCGELTGGLYRDQVRVIASLAAFGAVGILALKLANAIGERSALIALAAVAATAAALWREYFRMVLLAYRRSHAVLGCDVIYAVVLAVGVALATLTIMPAAAAAIALALAALLAGARLSRSLREQEPWNPDGAPGILRKIAPLGAWSTAGAAIHWTFSQGYIYLAAATLDVSAVAAIAATRLLAMPVNLLSTGIGSLMLPLASRWMHEDGERVLLRRLATLALGMAAVAIAYFALLWVLRDFVFDVMLRKQFAQRDLLLLLWSGAFVLMVIHQQLLFLLTVRERFRILSSLALVTASVSVATGWFAMQHLGGAGAPLGILVGEAINAVGVVVLCLREVFATKRPVLAEPQAAA
jgi:O-antigen/teichoic acid export membrane protein